MQTANVHALTVQLPFDQILNVHLTEAAAVRVWTEVAVAKAQAQAAAEAEQAALMRRYHTKPERTPGLDYDDRLTVRTGRSLKYLYKFLALPENKGGLRNDKGSYYVVTELAVREWQRDVKTKK
jgi:hypothetical protein